MSYPTEYAAPRPGEELDWARLDAYIRSHVEGLEPLSSVHQFRNGSANLTYLLTFGTQPLVLRRPPFGHVAVGAHDMRREFKALSRLYVAYDRAPRAYRLCTNHDVIGSDFLVMEYRVGQVVWGRIPPNMAHHEDVARRLGFAVVDALAQLHLLDPDKAGLGDLGRPVGFLERQLNGWRQRWAATSHASTMRLVDEVGARLDATKPSGEPSSILHNDFKIDNCQFDPQDPDRVRSVFDWDMATLGDPLIDLGILLNYWPDPLDVPEDPPMHPPGLEKMGLPSRQEIVARYAQVTGRNAERYGWYEAFGCWKTAIVVAQLHERYLRGETQDERQGAKGERVESLARRARRILEHAT